MQQKRNQQAEIRLGSHGEDYGSWMSNPVFYIIGGITALAVVLAVLSFSVFHITVLGVLFSVVAAALMALLFHIVPGHSTHTALLLAGGMLGIKPILAVIEGKVALAGKARGLPGVYVALFKKIDEMGGIHPGYTPLLGYTVNHRELQPLLTYLQDNLHLDAPLVRQIGCVIGTHTGPGAFGIAFFDKELTLE